MDMTPMFDTAERKLKRVKINLLRDDRFAYWRGIMMIGETRLDDNMPTAATDGCNEIYGRAFVESQNDKQLAFGVLHENLHKIGRDLGVWRKLFEDDHMLANMACDYHHNLLLVDMDPMCQTIEFPTNPDGSRMGLLDERFRGMDVPAIFRLLKQEKKDGTGAFSQGGDGSSGKGNFDEHQWGEAQDRTPEQQDALAKEIDQALRQGEMEHRKVNGNKAGDMERHFGELTKPKIDWKRELADFWRSNCAGRDDNTWRMPNRRFVGMDILLPSTFSQRVGRGVIGVDTSGSITGHQINKMLSEVVYVATQVHPEQIDLLYWDSAVARHETYDETNLDTLATSTKPAGGGGTSPACVKRYMTDKGLEPEFIIMLTDGYVDSWPDFDCPVLWVITTKGITAKTGISLHLDDND
jgi:predicted metal-dependent peptidase